MAETRDSTNLTDTPDGVTMLAIPEEHIDKVQEYLAGLQQEEAEVAGYTYSATQINRGAYAPVGTNCRVTTIYTGSDWGCSDYTR